jgi:hypothetical protein
LKIRRTLANDDMNVNLKFLQLILIELSWKQKFDTVENGILYILLFFSSPISRNY